MRPLTTLNILSGFLLLASPGLGHSQGFRATLPNQTPQPPPIRELPRVVGGYLGGSFVGNPGAGNLFSPANQLQNQLQNQNLLTNPYMNPYVNPYQSPYSTNTFSPSPFSNPFVQNPAFVNNNPWQTNNMFNPMNPFQPFPNQFGPYNPYVNQQFMQFPQNNPFQPGINPAWNNPWNNPWNNAPVVGVNNMFLGGNPGPVIGGGFAGFGGFGGGGNR